MDEAETVLCVLFKLLRDADEELVLIEHRVGDECPGAGGAAYHLRRGADQDDLV